MAEGCDYSFDRPNVTALWAAGIRFAGRYYGLGSESKLTHTWEQTALSNMGISLFNLAEEYPTSALGGFGKGTLHAIKVLADMDAKGVPSNRPAYFAVDFDVTTSQWPAVRDYFAGVNSILPLDRIGIYGGIRAMQWAQRDGSARWFFQTYAWSSGRVFPDVHVLQYSNGHYVGGGKVDYCRSYKDDFGQWAGVLLPPAPPPSDYIPGRIDPGVDYVQDIDALSGNYGARAGTVDAFARDLDGLRTL